MKIRPIRSESDYGQALRRAEALWGAPLNTPDGDELEILVALIETYEREHFPVSLPGPIDAIKFRLEQMGADDKALIGILGQRTRVYEVLQGKRQLSLNMIRKLHSKLGIPAAVLIQPVAPKRAKVSRRRPAAKASTRRAVRKSA
jgi:HTH-type transcriptional regulator/antitoxin HigA